MRRRCAHLATLRVLAHDGDEVETQFVHHIVHLHIVVGSKPMLRIFFGDGIFGPALLCPSVRFNLHEHHGATVSVRYVMSMSRYPLCRSRSVMV